MLLKGPDYDQNLDYEELKEYLSYQRGSVVTISAPIKGEKKKLDCQHLIGQFS